MNAQYKGLNQTDKEHWKNAIDWALEDVLKNGYPNKSTGYNVIYKQSKLPPKGIIQRAFDYLNERNITTPIKKIYGGANDNNSFLQSFDIKVLPKTYLHQLIEEIEIWDSWRNSYRKFIPLFIEEASTGKNWKNWDQAIFYEFFEKARDQCVASMQQGYFSTQEKEKIKENWSELAPLLQTLAQNQSHQDLITYNSIKDFIRKHTTQNKKAASNRLIASLHPTYLTTVVNEEMLRELINLLNVITEDFDIQSSNDWFQDSYNVLSKVKEKSGIQDVYDMVTIPWQLYSLIKENNYMGESKNVDIAGNEIVNLLNYKKQIILQGPPGTGKTRLAKEIAQELIEEGKDINLSNYLKEGLSIPNASGAKDYYFLEKVTNNGVELSSEKATKKWSASFNKIQEKLLQLQRGESPANKGGDDPYVLAVAKYVYKNIKHSFDSLENNDQFKLIQFHPSYTYEDFVRGIVAESNGENIEYKNVNKTLGLFAEKALKNYVDSNKDIATISSEIRTKEAFEKFKEYLNDEIEKSHGFYNLTENVGLISTVDEDAFRYKGRNEGWLRNGNRMLFSDILQAYTDNNTVRQDIKKNKLVSGLARQHASYFIRVVNLFQEFVEKGNITNNSEFPNTKIKLKNFVLIIDEINRANLSSVLGELIYALEYRGKEVESMYEIKGDGNKLTLPPNLYIIGTMNTADRSVGHIDYAIRRRFAFVDVLPTDLSGEEGIEFDSVLFDSVAELFVTNLSPEFETKDVQLGHSYFIDKSEEGGSMNIRLEYEIKPILLEYVKDGVLIGDEIKQKINKLEPSI